MKRVKVFGKFDRIGEQLITEKVIPSNGEVPIRWTVKVLGFFKVTVVGRVVVEEA